MTTNTARPAVAAYTFDRSKQLFEQAMQVIPAGGQATRLPPYEDYPTYFQRAKGCRVWDVDGNACGSAAGAINHQTRQGRTQRLPRMV